MLCANPSWRCHAVQKLGADCFGCSAARDGLQVMDVHIETLRFPARRLIQLGNTTTHALGQHGPCEGDLRFPESRRACTSKCDICNTHKQTARVKRLNRECFRANETLFIINHIVYEDNYDIACRQVCRQLYTPCTNKNITRHTTRPM